MQRNGHRRAVLMTQPAQCPSPARGKSGTVWRIGLIITAGILAMELAGCGGALPSIKNTTQSPWHDFAQAKASFDLIVPEETRVDQLRALGYDPVKSPNVRRLNYLEVIQAFMPHPSVQVQDLDPRLQSCVQALDDCYAFDISPSVIDTSRHGNVLMDVFGFRQQSTTTGWKFNAVIVLHGDLVIYKVWNGEPNILREEDKKRPLGPLQSVGQMIESGSNF